MSGMSGLLLIWMQDVALQFERARILGLCCKICVVVAIHPGLYHSEAAAASSLLSVAQLLKPCQHACTTRTHTDTEGADHDVSQALSSLTAPLTCKHNNHNCDH